MALLAAMVSAFKYCGNGVPNMVRAVAAIEGRRRVSVVWVGRGGVCFNLGIEVKIPIWEYLP